MEGDGVFRAGDKIPGNNNTRLVRPRRPVTWLMLTGYFFPQEASPGCQRCSAQAPSGHACTVRFPGQHTAIPPLVYPALSCNDQPLLNRRPFVTRQRQNALRRSGIILRTAESKAPPEAKRKTATEARANAQPKPALPPSSPPQTILRNGVMRHVRHRGCAVELVLM